MKHAAIACLLALALSFPAVSHAGKARAALIKEQGVTFAVVHVDYAVVRDKNYAAKAQRLYESYFDVPVVLMSDDNKRTKWYGRTDIVDFISDYGFGDLPWKIYNLPE